MAARGAQMSNRTFPNAETSLMTETPGDLFVGKGQSCGSISPFQLQIEQSLAPSDNALRSRNHSAAGKS